MTDDRRQPRLQDAIARNRGKQLLPLWIREFRRITGHSIEATDFVGVAETNRLRDSFYERVKAETGCCIREWPAREYIDVLGLLTAMSESTSVEVVLFSGADAFIGGLRVQSALVLAHAHDLRSLVEQDPSIASEDMGNGLCLEFNYHSDSGEYSREGFYRVLSWGVFCDTPGLRKVGQRSANDDLQ